MQTSQCVLRILITLSGKVPAVVATCGHSQSPLLFVCTGEGGLEVRCHGRGPDLPVDVHHRVSAGNRRTLPAAVALWDVVKPN